MNDDNDELPLNEVVHHQNEADDRPRRKVDKKRKDFIQLLRDTPWVHRQSSWKVTKDALTWDPRFKAVEDDALSKKWFEEFQHNLKRQDFVQLLTQTEGVKSRSSWDDLKSDQRFHAFKDEALSAEWLNAFIQDLKRKDFMQLLRDTPWIHSKSSWEVTQDALKLDPRFEAVKDDTLSTKPWFDEFKKNLIPCHVDEKGANNSSVKFWICLLVFSPLKWYHGTLWISIPHMFVFGIHLAKLVATTIAVFSFGGCRAHLSDTITHGQLAIKHNLLKGWSADFETLPFPPSIGPFAVYNVEDLIGRINFAVEGYFNMEYQATGHYNLLAIDQIDMNIRYINVSASNITIQSSSLAPKHGLTHVTKKGHLVYKYDVLKELEFYNLSEVFNSFFDVTLTASVHTFCVLRNGAVICLQIQIYVWYSDSDFNGEVDIGLQTTTTTVACQRMNITATDAAICEENANGHLSVITLTSATCVFDFLSVSIGLLIMCCYSHTERVTSFWSYILRWWSLLSLIGDVFIFIGETLIHNENNKRGEQKLRSFDKIAFFYGIGCLLCWIGFMRYLKIHRKFSLLFHTIYHAKSNILAFLLCTGILFTAYWACAFVTLGVYHPKFETKGRAAASLSALMYADDIFGTVASVHYEHAGNEDWLIASVIIVIYSFVFLFTLLGLNLIISLINTSYTTLNEIEYKGVCTTVPMGTVSMFYFLNGEETQKGHAGIGIGAWLFGNRFYYRLTCRTLEYLKT